MFVHKAGVQLITGETGAVVAGALNTQPSFFSSSHVSELQYGNGELLCLNVNGIVLMKGVG